MEKSYYGVHRTDEYLAHYGVKGMKWGVRKARESGNTKALSRQYAKAQKKLAKLEKRAASGQKYAKRAAKLGAGAAALGGLAAVGATGVSNAVRAGGKIGAAMQKGAVDIVKKNPKLAKYTSKMATAGRALNVGSGATADAIDKWAGSYSIRKGVQKGLKNYANSSKIPLNAVVNGNIVDAAKQRSRQFANNAANALKGGGPNKIGHYLNNATIARAGAAAAGLGLAGAAGYNAYRAATTKRAAKKAAQFRSEMNKAFAGTQYASKPRQGKKRRARG